MTEFIFRLAMIARYPDGRTAVWYEYAKDRPSLGALRDRMFQGAFHVFQPTGNAFYTYAEEKYCPVHGWHEITDMGGELCWQCPLP